MKKVIFAVLFCQFTNVYSQTEHDHAAHSNAGAAVSLNHLLDDFDQSAAIAKMDELKIPEADRKGYLRYLKAEYVKTKFPDFNFNELIANPYINLRPQNSNSTRSIYCTNADFELFDFTNWLGGTSTYGNAFTNTNFQSNGLNAAVGDPSARHTITTTPALNNDPGQGAIVGYDEIAINPISGLAEIPLVAPNGGVSSCRLGNANTGAEIERLYYDMNVTANNTTFYYQFAIVLQDPGHAVADQPYFKITVRDQFGAQIGGVCGVYDVNSTLASSDPSFIEITYAGEPLFYRQWELVSVDLTAFIGTTIRIEFESADCDLSGHFGYAYIDAGCGMLDLASSFCSSDDTALIVAPGGFDAYQWYGPNDDNLVMAGEVDDSLFLSNPTINDTFYVSLESASGCISNLAAVLAYTTVTAGFVQVNNSCPGGASGSATVMGQGSTQGYNYLWTPGNDTTSTVTDLAPGDYNVHIESIDPSCGTFDTLITVGTNPVIPLQFISNFCGTGGNAAIIAPAGSGYQWYDVSQNPIPAPSGINDTLNVTGVTNGQDYYVSYTSTQGCSDSAVITMSQTSIPGSLSVNVGSCGQVTINYNFSPNTFSYDVNGPSYNFTLNNTSQTSVSLTGLLPGSYTATIFDAGCSSSSAFDITYSVTNTPVNAPVCPYGTQIITSTSAGTHNWTDPSGNQTTTGASQNYTFPTTPPIAGVYVDTCVVGTGCIEISTFNVTVTPTQTNPTENLLPCPLDDVPITSTASGTHFWQDPNSVSMGSTVSTNFTINDIIPGMYTDSTLTTSGCVVISNYSVTYNQIITSTSQTNVLCYGDTTGIGTINIISGPAGVYTYAWDGPSTYVATGSTQNDLFAGLFVITTANGNCNTTDSILIISPSMPADTLMMTTTFCDGDPATVLFAPEGFTNYQWYFGGVPVAGETEDSLIITNTGQYLSYSVTYDIPPFGCERSTTVFNRIIPGPTFMPTIYNNVFSPNNDNVNPFFYPFYELVYNPAQIEQMTDQYVLTIYNRWGLVMYTSTNYSQGWTGDNEGKECGDGVYYWTIVYKPNCGDDGDLIKTNGVVHLIR